MVLSYKLIQYNPLMALYLALMIQRAGGSLAAACSQPSAHKARHLGTVANRSCGWCLSSVFILWIWMQSVPALMYEPVELHQQVHSRSCFTSKHGFVRYGYFHHLGLSCPELVLDPTRSEDLPRPLTLIAQNNPKALYNMVFGPKSLKI